MSDIAPAKPLLFRAVTGNRLLDGEVVFWNQGAWAEQFADIELFDDAAAAEAALAGAQAQPTAIVDPYMIEVKVEDGLPVPTAYRERVRALGPTIHPDMGKQVEGGAVIDAIAHAAGAARSAGRARLIRR
jgi:hypothetical protein